MPEKKHEAKNPDVKISARKLLETYNADQRKFAELQRRENGVKHILAEILVAAEALKEISKAKKDDIMLVSLGAGIYAEAAVSNVKKFKDSLAGNVLVDTDAKDVLEKLENEKKGAQKELTGIRNEMIVTSKNLENISSILQEGQRSMHAKPEIKADDVS